MCGIIGYIGHRNVQEVLLKGLETLEYRERTYSGKKKGRQSAGADAAV